MDRSQIETAIIDTLNLVQSMSGHECSPITSATCPFTDLTGFDSIIAVEVSCILSDHLGVEVPFDIFLSNRNDQPLTVSDVLDKLETVLSQSGG